MDLVQFLRERLDEDKRIALAATWCEDAGTWHAEASEYGTPARPTAPRWYVEDSMDDGVITTVDPQASDDEGVARHIAAWDPARVLAEVEAKLSLLETCEAFLHEHEGVPDPCAHSALLSLARPHYRRPDFDPAWLEN